MSTAPVAQVRTVPAVRAALPPKPSPERYQHVVTELRWIGAMVGAVAVILIVLSFVLPRV